MGLFGSTKQLSLCVLTGPVADLSWGEANPARIVQERVCRRGCAGHTMCVCWVPAAAGFNWQVLRQLPCSLGSMGPSTQTRCNSGSPACAHSNVHAAGAGSAILAWHARHVRHCCLLCLASRARRIACMFTCPSGLQRHIYAEVLACCCNAGATQRRCCC